MTTPLSQPEALVLVNELIRRHQERVDSYGDTEPSMTKGLPRLRATLATLVALGEDRERLDWLEENATVIAITDGSRLEGEAADDSIDGEHLRQAIDRARGQGEGSE